MNLSPREADIARRAIAEVMSYRRRMGPIPDALVRLHRRLDTALAGIPEQETPPILGDEIGTADAAHILGVSRMTVRRLAADLDGVQVSGRWVFSRTAVQQYAQARDAA